MSREPERPGWRLACWLLFAVFLGTVLAEGSVRWAGRSILMGAFVAVWLAAYSARLRWRSPDVR